MGVIHCLEFSFILIVFNGPEALPLTSQTRHVRNSWSVKLRTGKVKSQWQSYGYCAKENNKPELQFPDHNVDVLVHAVPGNNVVQRGGCWKEKHHVSTKSYYKAYMKIMNTIGVQLYVNRVF